MRYIIVDLEATCWENRSGQAAKSEIIEIGAVSLESANGPLDSSFTRFIRPLANPILSDFCRELTSIQQSDVDNAATFPEVFTEFLDWAGPQPWVFCSWGNYDIRQIALDCRRHGLVLPDWNYFINLKTAFAKHHNIKRLGLGNAIKHLGLQFQGTHHRGIDDARNIARVALTFLNTIDETTIGEPVW